MWQSRGKDRMTEYYSLANHTTLQNATVDDILEFPDLSPGVPVHRVLSTESGILCYKYE